MNKDLEQLLETDTASYTAQDTAHTLHMHCTDTARFTPSEVMQLVGISERTVYKYSGQLIETWYWLPESAIRESGRYTEFAVVEMRRLKAIGNISRYQQEVSQENNRPLSADSRLKTSSAMVKATSLKIENPADDLYALINEELALTRIADNDINRDLKVVEAEIVSEFQEFSESLQNERELRERRIKQQAVRDALEDEKAYQEAYQATRNHVRNKLWNQ